MSYLISTGCGVDRDPVVVAYGAVRGVGPRRMVLPYGV